MITAMRLKFCTVSLAALAMAACSSGYDYYDENSAYGDSQYGATAYAGGYGMAGYGMDGYGMGGAMMSGHCMPGVMGGQPYGGGYIDGGLRGSGGRYGIVSGSGEGVGTGGYVEYSGKKSRYGTWEPSGSAANAGCQMGGYWTIPTYQYVQQPPAITTPDPVPATVVTNVQESCPDGQYRMDNGDCAIMMTEETEQYVPPISTAYPDVQPADVDWYNPIRK